MLHFSPTIEDLGRTSAAIFDFPVDDPGPTVWDVSAWRTESRGFFKITEFPGTKAADFEPKDDVSDESEPLPDYELETLTGFSYPLQTDVDLPIHFRLLDGATGKLVPLDGTVLLALRDTDGKEVLFSYTLTPSSVQITGGIVNATVRLTTSGPLERIWLDVMDITPVASALFDDPRKPQQSPLAEKKKIKNNGTNGLTGLELGRFQNLSPFWSNPLPETWPLTGSFGEWREGGDGPSGRPHEGIDLAAPGPLNMPNAAPATKIRPVKRGVVSQMGELDKDNTTRMRGYLIIDHGDGTASEYLHVRPLVKIHEPVETTTIIAEIADSFEVNDHKKASGDHLHLELRVNIPIPVVKGSYAYGRRSRQPGVKIDPVSENARFDRPLVVANDNDTNVPEIRSVFIWGEDPKTAVFKPTKPGLSPQLGAPCKALVSQIVDVEGGNLVPKKINFVIESVEFPEHHYETINFSHGRLGDGTAPDDVGRLFQKNLPSRFQDFGYVRRDVGKLPRPAMYQYWFKWDKGLSSSYHYGPLKVTIAAEDWMERSAKHVMSFGPKITDPGEFIVNPEAPDGTTKNLEITSFIGPFPYAQVATQGSDPVDNIELSFIPPAGTNAWKTEFVTAGGNVLTPAVVSTTGRYNKTTGQSSLPVKVRISGRPGTIPPEIEEVKVRAVSKLFPLITHEIDIVVVADFAPVSLAVPSTVSYSGTYIDSWEGLSPASNSFSIKSPSTFTGYQTTGTYSYVKTGTRTGTLTYTSHWAYKGESETERGSILLTFTSTRGGTYTSSGSYVGTDIDGAYTGSFSNGTGSFTYAP